MYQDSLTDDGARNFETEDYKPWGICYYSRDKKWVIIKENGVKQRKKATEREITYLKIIHIFNGA